MPSAAPVACVEQPCPYPAVDRGRCTFHLQSTSERGYGAGHQADRRELERTLPAPCWYGCGRTMTADSDWVAAHVVDGNPASERVVSCRGCNERAKVRAIA